MFKKLTSKTKRYADGGNVASGPNYGASQLNPVMGGINSPYPAAPQAPQARFGNANPPAFAPANGVQGAMAPKPTPFKNGGKVKAKAKPKKSSASRRGDGIASKGKTKGKFV